MERTIQFDIDENSSGQRLDGLLAVRVTWLSRLRLKQLLCKGACTVNHIAARAGQRIHAGDFIELLYEETAPSAMTPEPLPLKIHYEDEHLLVVDKPAGMLVHPTRSVKSGTLANALTYHLNREMLNAECRVQNENTIVELHNEYLSSDHSALCTPHSVLEVPAIRDPQLVRPGIVHRLDRATSGLMLIAKTQRALSRLSCHFQRRLVEKRYLALVCGVVVEDEKIIDAPIGRNSDVPPHWGIMEGGKPAETRLRVLERNARVTLVELEPITGRTNQLRIHCAHLGHPIAGDEWYGASPAPRLCLHAARLAFFHPATNERLAFTSPLPDEIRRQTTGAGAGAGAGSRRRK